MSQRFNEVFLKAKDVFLSENWVYERIHPLVQMLSDTICNLFCYNTESYNKFRLTGIPSREPNSAMGGKFCDLAYGPEMYFIFL